MILVFIEGAYPFRVDDEDVNFLAIISGSFEGHSPTPKSLCARIDGWAHTKSVITI